MRKFFNFIDKCWYPIALFILIVWAYFFAQAINERQEYLNNQTINVRIVK